MTPEDVAKGNCMIEACQKKSILTMKVMTDKGPVYTGACEDHLDQAKEFIDAVRASAAGGAK